MKRSLTLCALFAPLFLALIAVLAAPVGEWGRVVASGLIFLSVAAMAVSFVGMRLVKTAKLVQALFGVVLIGYMVSIGLWIVSSLADQHLDYFNAIFNFVIALVFSLVGAFLGVIAYLVSRPSKADH